MSPHTQRIVAADWLLREYKADSSWGIALERVRVAAVALREWAERQALGRPAPACRPCNDTRIEWRTFTGPDGERSRDCRPCPSCGGAQ